MEKNGDSRKLRAVLFADVEGYTALMHQDEEGTQHAIGNCLREFENHIGQYGGEVLEVRGDGVFALFESAVNAVKFAVEIQNVIHAKYEADSENRQIRFRMGINLGEVLSDQKHIYGDSVNIASRIERLAEPGGICISGGVYQQIKNKLHFGYECMGLQELKNIQEPVEVFKVREETDGVTMAPSARPVAKSVDMDVGPSNRPSVAVLPFKSLNDNPEQDYFSDGITEDIITNLSKFHSLFVIARGSAFFYKSKDAALKQVGRELGVRYVATGSVRHTGNRIRISVQLVDTESGRTVWAERYDRDFDDIFDVQDEITNMIVSATASQIEAAERERMGRMTALDVQAYGLVLQGQHRVFRYTRYDNFQARRLYESALEYEPDYARAIAAISRTLNVDWRYSWVESRDEALDRALELAQKAVLLDESDARGFGELGFAHLYRKEHDASINAYTRALTLNPNDADLMSDMADALAHCGRSQEAVELLEKAMRLNPFYPDQYLWHLSGAYFNLRRYEDAIDAVMRMHNPTEGRRILAASYGHLGQLEQARSHAEKVLEAHPDFSLERWAEVQPDKNPEYTEHFVDGLKRAGL